MMVLAAKILLMLLLCAYVSGMPSHGDQTDEKLEIEPRMFRGQASVRPAFQVKVQHDGGASPYYKDPEGRHPSPLPKGALSKLTFKEKPCELEYKGRCRDEDKTMRTLSGRCNNLQYPEFGAKNQPMIRLLPINYHDGNFQTRSVTGNLLPNPRTVSLAMRKLPQAKPTEFNAMVMQLGQFIDHDFALTPHAKDEDDKTLECKDCESWEDPACVPISIPPNDPFLQGRDHHTGKKQCLPFTRSAGVVKSAGFGRHTIEQINQNTAFLDLSTVYGSDDCKKTRLRLFSNGHMAETRVMDFTKGVLPMAPASSFEECRTAHGMCFLAGDERSNEHLGIMVTHMLYLREHNRIAMELTKINPHWDDEKLYQVARKINIAQYQHMVYNEFVPALVGWYKAREYGLLPQVNGYTKDYDSRVNPGVLNEFATSAFRMGHTMIPEDFRMLDMYYKPVSSFPLVSSFHNTTMVFPMESTDYLLRGLIGTRLNPIDLNIVDVVLDRLFEKIGKQHTGEDLFARNVLRGRDHGLASYTKYREFCGLGKTRNFDDLRSTMIDPAITLLRGVYESVHDIDLYVGGLAERASNGAMIGPTFACIIAFQFLNSKRGDRFWYEGYDAGFSHHQLHAIRSTTSIARLICENMAEDKDHALPVRALRLPCNRKNPLVKCSELKKLDLSLWVETPSYKSKNCMYMSKEYRPGAPVYVSPCLHCTCHSQGKLSCKGVPEGCSAARMDEYCKLYCKDTGYH